MNKSVLLPVADPGGHPRCSSPTPTDQNFLNFMQFLENFVGVVTLCAQDISANQSCDDIYDCVK